MFNACPACGEYSVEKDLPRPGVAVCPYCDHEVAFRQQPLFVITGASGSGKSALAYELIPSLDQVAGIETDILWDRKYWSPETGFREYNEIWLRLAKNIGQAGRPVLLFRPCVPEQLERCHERRYFAAIHYLALVCDEDVLVDRLHSRAEWRNTGSPEYVKQMIEFNAWLKAHVSDHLTLLDTSQRTVGETAELATKWVDERLRGP